MRYGDLLTICDDEPRRHYGDDGAAFVLAREIVNVRVVARFTIDGEPVSKSRARFTKRGSKTFAYTPEKTHQAELMVAAKFRQAAIGFGTDSTSSFGLACKFFNATRQRRDVDNMIKLICDGLNGVAYKDDAQVQEVSGSKHYVPDRDHARTEVLIYTTGPIERNTEPCQQCGTDMDIYRSTQGVRRFCSQECHLEWRRIQRSTVCKTCGVTIDALHSDRAVYCSQECRRAAHNQEFICSECGSTFSGWSSMAQTRKTFWCSDSCRAAGRVKRELECIHGHAWAEFGKTKANGKRYCRECARLRVAAAKAAKRAAS